MRKLTILYIAKRKRGGQQKRRSNNHNGRRGKNRIQQSASTERIDIQSSSTTNTTPTYCSRVAGSEKPTNNNKQLPNNGASARAIKVYLLYFQYMYLFPNA